MTDTKSSAPNPPSGSSGSSLGQRVMGFLRPGAGAQRRPQSSTSRFITGSVTFVLVAELLTFGLQYITVQFKLPLQQEIIGPQVSWFTWFFLINVTIIIALWITLQRLGLFPKDMWRPRNGTTTTTRGGGAPASGSSATSTSSGGANQIPGIGKSRTRAERRYTAAVEAAKTVTTTKRRFGRATTTTTTATTTRATKTPVATVPNTKYDGDYERVRAAQRQRKRRAAR